MKKLLTLAWVFVTAGLCTSIGAQDFDAKLKRFITITDNKYIPEISCDEAVKLGFTVNDYNRFEDYVRQLNVKTAPALTLPKNLFLCSFIEFDGDKTVLAIPLEKALRAGATAEGYYQTLEVIRANDEFLANENFFPKGEREKNERNIMIF